MANKHTIKTQNDESNYLKSKLYELAKTNKYLEKELKGARSNLKHTQKYHGITATNMANNYTKVMENKIKTQSDEINYLKSKLYELAKTNKYLEKELEGANRKIQNNGTSNKNSKNNEKHDVKAYDKWHKVENKRSRKNQLNKFRNRREKMVSKHRNYTSKPPNTRTINMHQRTNRHAEENKTNTNEMNKNEKPYPTRQTYTQRNTYIESRRYKQLGTKNDR